VALGLIGGQAAASDLAFSLKDASARVRREAATALGKIRAKDDSILAALRQAEQDGDKAVRREATAALKKIEGRRKG
jgi:HEAT repeat protein